MFDTCNTTATWAIRVFSQLAREYPDDFNARYDWTHHTQAEVEAIWDEVIAKIPAEATKVLEIGCGGGGLAAKLKVARPDIGYHGIDVAAENIATAEALGLVDYTFEQGSLGEVLSDPEGDWDFVVSVGCLFTCTDRRFENKLAELLDSAAPKGYILVMDQNRIPRNLESLIQASPDLTESYTEGARDFLDPTLLAGSRAPGGQLFPMYVHRSTSSIPERPVLRGNQCPFKSGKVEIALLGSEIQYRRKRGEDLSATIDVPVVDANGRVISTEAKAPGDIDPRKVNKERARGGLPPGPDLPAPEGQRGPPMPGPADPGPPEDPGP